MSESVRPYRYVVLVWFDSHWSVNVASDDGAWAEEVLHKASESHLALLVDVAEGTTRGGQMPAKHVEAVVRDRGPWPALPAESELDGLP